MLAKPETSINIIINMYNILDLKAQYFFFPIYAPFLPFSTDNKLHWDDNISSMAQYSMF